MLPLSDDTEPRYIPPEFDHDNRHLDVLLRAEKTPSPLALLDEWIRCHRSGSIDWILRTRATFGFRSQTAYLSVTYLDHFLSIRGINRGNDWTLPLLSVACLSLAAKMEESMMPPLSEFTLAEGSDMYRFESSAVQRMELLVLSTLEWKMRLVTPFAYINCFITKLCGDQSMRTSMISRIVQTIMASMRDINLMSHRPSIIACAATMVALDSKLTVPDLELKIGAHAPFPTGFLKMMDIVSCYIRMQELHHMENSPLPECLESPDMSRVRWRVDSGLSNKRKRLIFEDCDQNYDVPNGNKLQ